MSVHTTTPATANLRRGLIDKLYISLGTGPYVDASVLLAASPGEGGPPKLRSGRATPYADPATRSIAATAARAPVAAAPARSSSSELN